jgi:hypothetical protein
MKEKIVINSSMMYYYEPGSPSDCSKTVKMAIPEDSVSYVIDTDYMPLKNVVKDEDYDCIGEDCYIDLEYRGIIPFFGEEYYVKDIDGDRIYLDRGILLDNVTNAGYNAGYEGYLFKVSSIVPYSGNTSVLVLDVQKPGGTVVQVQLTGSSNGIVDGLEIMGVDWQVSGSWQGASIMVYDLSGEIVLENGEDLEIGGQAKDYWKVHFEIADNCMDDDFCDLTEYYEMDWGMSRALLKSIAITYDHGLSGGEALAVNESLNFPAVYKLRFRGYLSEDFRDVSCPVYDPIYATYFIGTVEQQVGATTTTSTISTTTSTTQACNLKGDYPPCGTVSLTEVVDYINKWTIGESQLADVISLINGWAAG